MKNVYLDMIKAAEELSPSELGEKFPELSALEIAELSRAARRTIREICRDSGLTGREICRRYGIPYQTMDSWTRSASRRSCPVYFRLLLQESLGIYRPPKRF